MKKGISPYYLIKLLIDVLPATLVVTIPMATLVGILLALGRLSTDNEITAMKSHGIGFHQILFPLLVVASLLSIFDFVFMDYALPRGNVAYAALKRDISRRNPAFVLEEGVIMKELEREGKLWMYESTDSKTGRLRDIKVWDSIWSGKPRFIHAREGSIGFENDQGWLELYDGLTYEPISDASNGFRVTNFAEHRIALDFTEAVERTQYESESPRSMSIADLKVHIGKLASRVEQRNESSFLIDQLRYARVEYHKKFSIPFACFVFGLIGVPLGLMVKRSGKMIGTGIGLVLILVYYLLLQVGQDTGRSGILRAGISMWMPNIVIGAIGLGFAARVILEGKLEFLQKPRLAAIVLTLFDAIVDILERLVAAIPKWRGAQIEAEGQVTSRKRGLRILDRYVLTEYLKAFVLALAFFIALVVIVRLLDKDIKRFDEDISYIAAIQIVLYQAPRRIMEVVPLASFLAAFFVLGRMVRNNELTAMKAAGVSVYRIIMPILVSTVLICVIFAVFYDRVASPTYHRANQLRQRIPLRRSRNVVFKGQQNRLFYIQNLDLENEIIDRMTIYEFDSNKNLTQEIFADSTTWPPNQWHLVNGFIRRFDKAVEVAFEPLSAKYIDRSENPERFAGNDKDLRAMTIRELRQQIRYKQMVGQSTRREQVRLQHKMAYPFAAFVVVLIGAPISIRFGRAGFFAGLVMAFFLSFLYWGLSFATLEGLGENGKLSPIMACWGANVVYATIGFLLIWKTPQ